ncbi:MAG: DNA repair protein RecN [Synechococcales cyanobacterium T60_A2020_003]|nr:DNA repair protein RecN [Synechococcales cyanobacterium T60_A2020_003]
MLVSLRIEDFALVDRLTIEFGAGLNILTGETGAGKSIVLDALDVALGGKVSSRMLRAGCERALVEATFALNPDLIAWLDEQQIERIDETSLVCSRDMVASPNGVRNRSRVNGILMNRQQMQSLREKLVEITAQGQTTQLGQSSLQREWLDGFGGSALLTQREYVSRAYGEMQRSLQALEKRRQVEHQRLQQLDLFEYQARELAAAMLDDPNEMEQLEQERQRLSHSVDLQQHSYQAYQILYQNDSGGVACADLLGQAEAVLQDMVQYDPGIESILEMVTSALNQVEEAGRAINAYGESLETDPERLQIVEERLVQLKQICRKYGPTLAEAIAHSQQVQADLDKLSDHGQSLEVLEELYTQRYAALEVACAALTDLRKQAAATLEQQLLAELKPLAMENVQFQVEIAACPFSATGGDRVIFLFSPNPGEPLQPLSETASGGEMSRFLLALKTCLSQVDRVGTMVFDEVDAGVSGRVAQAIAEKLHQISRRQQVLCVTHQHLIAVKADYHFHVRKEIVDEVAVLSGDDAVRTVVRVAALDDRQRVEELAQLAGGSNSDEMLAFAESLRSQQNDLAGETVDQPSDTATPPVVLSVVQGKKTSPRKGSSSRSRSSSKRSPKAL